MKPLPQDFYARDTIDVAIQLIGKTLIHRRENGREQRGFIVETEAYLGLNDPASHSFGGRRTARTEVMFGRPGLAYVYFIYGMHHCFNVITAAEGVPEAVLVRAVQPFHQPSLRLETSKTANGPGKLCREFHIGRSHNGVDLTRSHAKMSLWIESTENPSELEQLAGWAKRYPMEIADGPRIGLSDKYDAAHWPLRFGWQNHPALSPAKFPEWNLSVFNRL